MLMMIVKTSCEILLSTFYHHNKCENLLWQWRQGKASCLCSCLEQDLISILVIRDLMRRRRIRSLHDKWRTTCMSGTRFYLNFGDSSFEDYCKWRTANIWMTSMVMMLLKMLLLLLTMMRVMMWGTCSGWQFLLRQPSWVRSPGRSKCGSDQESSNDCSDGDDHMMMMMTMMMLVVMMTMLMMVMMSNQKKNLWVPLEGCVMPDCNVGPESAESVALSN